MAYLKLNESDGIRIRKALESSFTLPALATFVGERFPHVSGEVTWMGMGQGLTNVAFQVVLISNMHGVLDQVILALVDERRARPDLLALALELSRRPGWTAANPAHGLAVESVLEKLTSSGDPFFDTTRLAQWLVRVERQVCQVRCGNEHGTGFLIGPDLVLTCFHVVKRHLQGAVPASGVQVRFDYRSSAAGEAPPYDAGTWLDIDSEWRIPRSPYSNADLTLEGEPTPAELDFAVLKLREQAGKAIPDGEHRPRGWVDLSREPPLPSPEAPMLIVQHPESGKASSPQMPLQIAFASPGFDHVNGNGTRIAYMPSTLKGSSGSPVFDRTLEAVALHHNRGQMHPSSANLTRNNRGIPLGKIRAALDESVLQLLTPPPKSS